MAGISKRTWTAKDGTEKQAWRLSYYDAAGKQRKETFKTKRAADARRVEVEGQLAKGAHIADAASKTFEMAGKAFLQDFQSLVNRGARQRSTLAQYSIHIRRHMEPRPFAATKLSRLSTPDCVALAKDLELDLSPATARKVLTTVTAVLTFAKKAGWIAENPSAGVRIRVSRHDDSDRKVQIPPKADVRALVEAARSYDNTGRMFATAALFTFAGLRASEYRALRWPTVSLARGTMGIEERADRWDKIAKPKSPEGIREIPLSPLTVHALRLWRVASGGGSGFVFPAFGIVDAAKDRGPPTDGVLGYFEFYRRVWYPLMFAAGLATTSRRSDGKKLIHPKFGAHALRHVACSLWIEQRATHKQVTTWAGHASVDFTIDRYGHLWPDKDDDAAILAAADRSIMGDENGA